MGKRVLGAMMGLLLAAPASAAVEFDFGGTIQYDLRWGLEKISLPWEYEKPDLPGISRNEVLGNVRFGVRTGKFGARADVGLVFRAYPAAQTLDELSFRPLTEPFRFEANALYIEGRDLFKGFDIRAGMQKIQFGVADQFNPTNTVNPNDVEDPLMFGDQQSVAALRVDYSPVWNWSFTAALIPIFKPMLLPRTAYMGQTADRLPFLEEDVRWQIASEQQLGANLGYPTVIRNVNVQYPEFNAKNMSVFVRTGGSIGNQDFGISYHWGYSDIPQPVQNYTVQNTQNNLCNPDDPADCVLGTLDTTTALTYGRQHVLGFNWAGEADMFGWLHKSFKPIGYWLEFAAVFPERLDIELYNEEIDFGIVVQPEGEYPYPNGSRPTIIDGRPFLKWTLGADYTFNRHMYMNTQWVHGFVDEYGAGDWLFSGYQTRSSTAVGDGAAILGCGIPGGGNPERCAYEIQEPRIGDYLVMGMDFKFVSGNLLLRLFGILDLNGVWIEQWDEDTGQRVRVHRHMFTKEGANAVIYPEIRYNFGFGFEMHAGALVMLGQKHSKFGAPESGGNQIFTRFKYSF